jgi:hypothetical protein
MNDFKIRASAASQIMTNARSKKETLSKTAQTYCQDWATEQLYGRRKEFSSKYTDKGNIVEQDAADFYAEQRGYSMLIINTDHYTNSKMMGTPDLILKDKIIDIKSSWSAYTFPLFETEPPAAYYWQAQVYMHLLGIHNFDLAYLLMDTPRHLIERECFWHCQKNGIEYNDTIQQQFTDKMTFGGIAPELRIKTFNIAYDASKIELLEQRVDECRIYINELLKTI